MIAVKNRLNLWKTTTIFGLNITELFALLILYSLTHGGVLLILNAIYWDDWILYRASKETIYSIFRQTGSMFNWVGILHFYFQQSGLWLYRILNFILMYFSGLLLFAIATRTRLFTRKQCFLLVIMFLTLPLNFARVANINFPYILCYFSFFLAWYFVDSNPKTSLVLFFFSFNTNSILIFYAIPMAEILYRHHFFRGNSNQINSIRNYLLLFFLPLIFYFIKTYFFPPTGLYQGYNQHFNFSKIPWTIAKQLDDFHTISFNVFLLIPIFPLAAVFVKWLGTQYQNQDYQFQKSTVFISIGIISLILACFPYWALSYIPTFFEWTSRHQLLMPLGFSLLLLGIVTVFPKRLADNLIAAIISSSICYGIDVYFKFYVDWEKQLKIVSLLQANNTIRNSSLIIFNDRSNIENGLHRNYRFYEWNGILEQAYGNQSHFGISIFETSQFRNKSANQYFTEFYKASSFKPDDRMTALLVELKRKNNNSHYLFPPNLDDLYLETSVIAFEMTSK